MDDQYKLVLKIQVRYFYMILYDHLFYFVFSPLN